MTTQTASVECPNCSARSFETDNYCAGCGRPLGSTAKIAKDFAVGVAEEIGKTGRTIMKSEGGKKIAAGAALGAVVAAAVPFFTLGTGAVLGAGFAAYRRYKVKR